MTSDELAALCPITLQPDLYVATIEYFPDALCLESKSVKLYLMQFRDEGQFCEALTVRIRDDVAAALELPAGKVHVTLRQKSRGGIVIASGVNLHEGGLPPSVQCRTSGASRGQAGDRRVPYPGSTATCESTVI